MLSGLAINVPWPTGKAALLGPFRGLNSPRLPKSEFNTSGFTHAAGRLNAAVLIAGFSPIVGVSVSPLMSA